MKRIMILAALVLLITAAQVNAMTYGAEYYRQHKQSVMAGTYLNDPIYLFMNETEGQGGMSNLGTGNVFYVDSNVANEGDGTSMIRAKDTLDEAIALCSDNNGDVIYVAQGHAETWSTGAMGVTIDVIGVTIIGLGSGSDVPTFTYTHADATIDISVASVTIRNLRFVCGVSAVVSSITLAAGADYLTIEGCEWVTPASATFEFYDMITLAAGSDYVTIAGNKFCSLTTTTGCNQAINADAGVVNRLAVVGNEFSGQFIVAGIHSDDIDLNIFIANNVFHNATTGQHAIEFTAAATGVCAYNIMYSDTVATTLNPGSMACFENYVINTVDLSATLFPPVPAIGTVTAGSADDILKKLYYGADGTDAYPATVANDSTLAKIMASGATATASTFDNTTDSLQAIRDAIDSLAGVGLRASCETDAVGATEFTSIGLAGFGNDFFNTGWYAIVTYDAGGAGAAPEGEVRDIVDYVSATGVFTVGPAFSAQVTLNDKVMIVRVEDLNLNEPAMMGSSANIWYVDSAAAGTPDTGENGKTWSNAYTTITAAEAVCSAGDVILVARNHNENILGAGPITANVAGISIIGMGTGNDRPLIDFDDATAVITLDNAGIKLANLRLRPGATDVAVGVRVEDAGIGCVIENCAFVDGEAAGTDEFTDAISVDTLAADLIVRNCTYFSTGNGCGTFVNLDEATIANSTIEKCIVYGGFAESGIWGAAAVPTNLNIRNNILSNTTSGQHCIEFQGAATGVCVNNMMYTDGATTTLDPGSMSCFENYVCTGINSSALLVPTSTYDAIIADLAGISQIGDKVQADMDANSMIYWNERTTVVSADEVTADIMDIQGGPIWITSIVGVVTAEIGGNATNAQLIVDRDDAAADTELTTAVAIQSDVVGTTYIFSNANPAVLTPLTPGAVGSTSLMMPWFVHEGMLEQLMSADPGGAVGDHITWYIRWAPAAASVTCVGQ